MRTKVRKSRTQFIAFYVDEEEKEMIVEAAKKSDMTISDYCRKMLLKTSREDVQ